MEEIELKPIFELVSIRELSTAEVPFILDYWLNSPPGYLESIGVDPAKLPPRAEFERSLREKCEWPVAKRGVLVIIYRGQAVGFHTLHPIAEGDYGIFHAHLWDESVRDRGIATVSYVKACHIFLNRFGLKRILFKTPIQNKGSIRVKEKLGIRYLHEERVSFGIVKDATLAKVFELTRDECDFLLLQMEHPDLDLSQIQRNLSMSPEQRLIEHQNALDLVLELQTAGKQLREQSQ
jgi:RimJ/RimL family protein N-acetyltransferase